MQIFAFFIKILNIFLVVKAQTNYCELPCGTTLNTVCARSIVNCGAGIACGPKFKVIQFTARQMNHFVGLHNNYRNIVALGLQTTNNGILPPATNMNALTWDAGLEYVAQCWANNCTFGHDKCRKTPKYSSSGQNLALLQTTARPAQVNVTRRVEHMIRNWFNEVKYYVYTPTFTSSTSNGRTVGHFTQLVWAEIKQVGYAMAFYTKGKWNLYYLVCNYGPAGNVRGKPVYKAGLTASACGSGTNTAYPGLCRT